MGVLIAMPKWAVPSELWAQRMIEALEPHVAAIATHDPPETHWRGRIPAVEVPHLRRPLWKKIARRIGVPVIETSSADALKQTIHTLDITAVLVHYLPFAPVPSRPPVHSSRTSNIHVLYLGRLVDFKGPDLVIRAFDRACELGFDGRLTLAGDGPVRAACERLRAASQYADRIVMPGSVDADQGEALRAEVDIFTAHNRLGPLSRQEEAFGVSVIEAMAAGIPVVSGGSGGLLETVVHEETGLLLKPNDVEAHAMALLRLGQDPAFKAAHGAGRVAART